MPNGVDQDRIEATTVGARLTDAAGIKEAGEDANAKRIGRAPNAAFSDTTGLYAALPFLVFVALIMWFLSRR